MQFYVQNNVWNKIFKSYDMKRAERDMFQYICLYIIIVNVERTINAEKSNVHHSLPDAHTYQHVCTYILYIQKPHFSITKQKWYYSGVILKHVKMEYTTTITYAMCS